MPNLVHSASRPTAPRSRLLVVRPSGRSVKAVEHPETWPRRLAVGVISVLAVAAATWLMGYLGFRLGFAPMMQLPDLVAQPGAGLVTGTLILINVPRVLFQAGMAEPLWLMIGFGAIALPAAALGAARPRTPGGPAMRKSLETMANLGATGALLFAIGLVAWTSAPVRTSLVQPLPDDPARADAWFDALQTAAGLDVLAVVVAALWVVLVFRLPIALWFRSISGAATIFAFLVAFVAMSMSNAAAAHVGMPRSLAAPPAIAGAASPSPETPPETLVLGSTHTHLATLTVSREGRTALRLSQHPGDLTVLGRSSIIAFLREHAVEEE
jgi:hypothetical protein